MLGHGSSVPARVGPDNRDPTLKFWRALRSSERPEPLVGLERERSAAHRPRGSRSRWRPSPRPRRGSPRRARPARSTRPSRSPTIQSPGATRTPPDDDGDVAVREQLPARHAVLRGHVAREDREVLAQDVVGVARAAVDHRAGAAARRERGDRELAEVRGGAVVGLVDGDVSRRHRAQHLEDPPDRGVVVVAGVRAAEHRDGRARRGACPRAAERARAAASAGGGRAGRARR